MKFRVPDSIEKITQKLKIKNLLKKDNLLVLLTIFVVFFLIIFMSMGLTNLIFVYILIACLVYYYSNKNMMYVLGVPFVVVLFLYFINTNLYMFEGMENSNLGTGTTKTDTSTTKKKTSQNTIPSSSNNTVNLDMMTDSNEPTNETSSSDPEPHSEESFEGNTKKGKYRLDYASTMEDAYNELNNVLGSDGIKNLTKDTHALMQKQLQLAEAMKSMSPLIQGMAPLLKQAQGLLTMSPSLAVTPPMVK